MAPTAPLIDADSHFLPDIDVEMVASLSEDYDAAALQILLRDAYVFAHPELRKEGFRGSTLGAKLTGGPRDVHETIIGHGDVGRRAELLLETGFEKQILIPDGLFSRVGGISSGRRLGRGIQVALASAYNDAVIDAQKRRPDRFIGSAIVPSANVDDAVREVRRASSFGLRSITLSGNWEGRNFDEFELAPLWRAVSDAGMLVLIHHNPFSCQIHDHVPTTDTAGGDRMRRLHISNYVGFAFEYAMVMASLTLGGVLESFPDLRFCFYEAGGSWLPWALYTLDHSYEIESQCARCSTAPSELILRSCLVAIEPDEEPMGAAVATIGSECYVVGSDYPHPPSTYPNTAEGVRRLPGLSESDKDNILGANIARVLAS